MTQQLGLVFTHTPSDGRLTTALRILQAWQHSQRPVFGLFLQGEGVTLAQRARTGNAAKANTLLDFCTHHGIAVSACVGSCQSRNLCDQRGRPQVPDWDPSVQIVGLGELSALLSDCQRVVSL